MKLIIRLTFTLVLLALAGRSLLFVVDEQYFFLQQPQETIKLALAVPLSEKNAAVGLSFKRGVDLYLDEVNSQGGVDGRRLELVLYDDKGNAEVAKKVAQQIVTDGEAVAVIGHSFSYCSIPASSVYEANEIPAITGQATNPKVTKGKRWYFRSIFNDDFQGRFIANYIKKVAKAKSISIIQEDLPYGTNLAAIIRNTAKQVDLEVNNIWKFEVKDEQLKQRFETIAAELYQSNDADIIVIAAHTSQGAKLIRQIRDAGVKNILVVPHTFDSQKFLASFDRYPKEKDRPGFYTDNTMVSSPLIFDTTNDKGQTFRQKYKKIYKEEPEWRSAFGYDTAMLLVRAISETDVRGLSGSLQKDRKKIRDYLAGINSVDKAIEGVTGLNYFTENGDMPKPVSMGVFKNRHIVSAPVQLQPIRDIQNIVDKEDALKSDKIAFVEGQYMYKTRVVFTGVQINKISDLDIKKQTAQLDFFIWFRSLNDIDLEKVQFANADEPVSLGTPVFQEKKGPLTYKRYHVTGLFKMNFLPDFSELNKYMVGFSLTHSNLPIHNLIFVADLAGMGLLGSETPPAIDKVKVLSPESGWAMDHTYIFRDIGKSSSMGELEAMQTQGGIVKFSRFNVGIQIKSINLSYRQILNEHLAHYLMIVVAILMILLMTFGSNLLQQYPVTAWILLTLFSSVFLLSSEVLLLGKLSTVLMSYHVKLIVLFFDILWWVILAWLMSRAVDLFIWNPLEKKTGNQVPSIVRQFIKVIIYLVATFCIIAFVFDQKITSLLATSGLIAMIIGLALQVNLSNVISGLALSLERPFKIGDWIEIDGMEASKVIEMNWRSVRLMTVCDTIYCVPNSKAADSTVLNYHYPDDYYWLYFPVYMSSLHSPDRVMKVIMDALLETDVVQKQMGPIVRMDYTDQGLAYYPIFLLKGYGSRAGDKNAVSKNIWKHLNRAGMTPAVPRQEIQLTRGAVDQPKRANTPFAIIEDSSVFQHFPEEIKENLAAHTLLRFFKKGEVIFHQGDDLSSMFIIAQGTVSLRVLSETGEDHLPTAQLAPGGGVKWGEVPQEESRKTQEIHRLGAGESLGERALMTCDPCPTDAVALTDCSLLEISKETLTPLVQENPDIEGLFADHIVELKAADHEREAMFACAAKVAEHDEEPKSLKERALCSLKGCFGKS